MPALEAKSVTSYVDYHWDNYVFLIAIDFRFCFCVIIQPPIILICIKVSKYWNKAGHYYTLWEKNQTNFCCQKHSYVINKFFQLLQWLPIHNFVLKFITLTLWRKFSKEYELWLKNIVEKWFTYFKILKIFVTAGISHRSIFPGKHNF